MTDTANRPATTVAHPLSMLTGEEITRAAELLRASGRIPSEALFAHMVLHEADKETVARFRPGAPIDREVRVVIITGPGLDVCEAVVSVTAGEIREFRVVEAM